MVSVSNRRSVSNRYYCAPNIHRLHYSWCERSIHKNVYIFTFFIVYHESTENYLIKKTARQVFACMCVCARAFICHAHIHLRFVIRLIESTERINFEWNFQNGASTRWLLTDFNSINWFEASFFLHVSFNHSRMNVGFSISKWTQQEKKCFWFFVFTTKWKQTKNFGTKNETWRILNEKWKTKNSEWKMIHKKFWTKDKIKRSKRKTK